MGGGNFWGEGLLGIGSYLKLWQQIHWCLSIKELRSWNAVWAAPCGCRMVPRHQSVGPVRGGESLFPGGFLQFSKRLKGEALQRDQLEQGEVVREKAADTNMPLLLMLQA